MTATAIGGAAVLLSFLLVALVRWDARRRGILDAPNARSSHAVPTPRGGGLGLVAALAGVVMPLSAGAWMHWDWIAAGAAVAIVAAIGWVDDHGGAPVRLRLSVHLAAGALLVPFAIDAPLPLPVVAAALWWVFWTVSAINVVNFIDGIDGIIGVTMLVFGASVALAAQPDGTAWTGGLALAGASIGFLLWNWSPARIFMGDVGSGALGVIAVALGAALVTEGGTGFVATFAPLAPIFLDAAATLWRRWRRGERLSQAHRSHLYQRLANNGLGHRRVALLYGGAALACAAAAHLAPRGGLLLLAGLLAALGAAGALLERRAAADPPVLP